MARKRLQYRLASHNISEGRANRARSSWLQASSTTQCFRAMC